MLIFLAVATQWRTLFAPSGRLFYFGLDYAGVDAVLRSSGHRKRRRAELMADIRHMEAEALGPLNEGDGS